MVEKGLIPAERLSQVAEGLAAGTLSAATWRGLAEMTLDAATRNAKP